MYRLLIVDDEAIIVNGLYDIFSSLDTVELDVYKAYSGIEAIQWLNRTRIDIVLTDIHMPEIDGMQLLDEILKRWLWCRVIFLTGHSKFDYAYKAIQHTNVRYILKTESYEKVISTVEDIILELQNEMKTSDLIQTAKDQINHTLELLRWNYFSELLNGNSYPQADAEEFKRLAVHLQVDTQLILVLGDLVLPKKSMSYWDKVQLLYSVRQLASRYLTIHINSLIVPLESERFAIFAQPNKQESDEKDGTYEKLLIFLKGTLEVVQSECRDKLDTAVNFALAEEKCSWTDLPVKYVSLNRLLNYRIGVGIETLLCDGEFHNYIRSSEASEEALSSDDILYLQALLCPKDLSDLQRALEAGSQEEYFELLNKYLTPLRRIHDKNELIALEVYQSLSLLLLSYINRWKLSPRLAEFVELSNLQSISGFNNWQEAADYLQELSDVLFQLQEDEQRKRTDNTILFVQNYIENNLQEDLSLVNLADLVYLNPSYLSRLYHQTTGHKLSKFIEEVRIHQAKILLQSSNIKVHEIAKQTGYETTASFSRFFKKSVGVSPQDYRTANLSIKNRQRK